MRKMGEKLFLCRGTDAYDKQLNELCLSTELRPFFGVLHPELLPYVGQNYKKNRHTAGGREPLCGKSHC